MTVTRGGLRVAPSATDEAATVSPIPIAARRRTTAAEPSGPGAARAAVPVEVVGEPRLGPMSNRRPAVFPPLPRACAPRAIRSWAARPRRERTWRLERHGPAE